MSLNKIKVLFKVIGSHWKEGIGRLEVDKVFLKFLTVVKSKWFAF